MAVQLKLLILDTSLKQRNTIKRALAHLNVFKVLEVKNSETALSLLKNQAVDLIITGLNIGSIDGWRFSRMIRSGLLRTPKNTPIVLTAPNHFERIADTTARSYGIDAVVIEQKMQQLPQILANVLSSHLEKSSRLNLLLIEPNQSQADEISVYLKDTFIVSQVTNSKDAISLFQQNSYSIVLINSIAELSPSTEGLVSLFLKLKANQAIVTIIDTDDANVAEQLLLSGVSDFVRLPFSQPLLNKVCDQAARREDFMRSYAEFATKVEQLSLSQQRYKDLFSAHQRILHHLNTVVLELDEKGTIRFINPAWETLLGHDFKSSLTKELSQFCIPEFKVKLQNSITAILKGEFQHQNLQLQLQHKLGDPIWVECRLQSIKSDKTRTSITASIDNIHERKQAEFQLQHLALHDTLTGLHNRHYFDLSLNQLCKDTKDQKQHALLYIDLDHFKVINDTLGHQQGDIVLKKSAKLFQHAITEGHILCRIGGDEFAVLLQDIALLDAYAIAETLCQSIEKYQFKTIERDYSISCSVGLTMISDENNDANECLKQSDIALYVAKNRGRNLVHCFSNADDESEKMMAKLAWTRQVRIALEQDQIELHFQPIWDFKQEKVAYFETLLRLRINNELIYPNQFIPPLELISDMNLLDHSVIKTAICNAAQHSILNKIAINLSAQAFSDEGLLPLIKDTLIHYKVDPQRIVFEITESASIRNLSATRTMIEHLKTLGCGFSIDDFGTGFSTFSYLKQLPADQVKIDGSFVKDMLNDPIDLALVKAIKDISHSLNKTCVAECVEDLPTFNALKEIGVDYAQGYLISRPLKAEDVSEQLKKITLYKTSN